MTARRRAAFLDRDGVINRDTGYVHSVANFEVLPGVVEALKRLQAADYSLIIVTNQSGLARGIFDEVAYEALTQHLHDTLAKDGITLKDVYHCPHLPDAIVARYRSVCDCRKPLPGLLVRAIADHDIDPTISLLVGDKHSDILAGRAARIGRCYFVGTATLSDADASYADLATCVAAVI